MVELLQKCLKEPEHNPELFSFIEDAFMHLDTSAGRIMANFPLFFTLHLASFFGFQLEDIDSERNPFLDLREGRFVKEHPQHPYTLEGNLAYATAQLLRVRQPAN